MGNSAYSLYLNWNVENIEHMSYTIVICHISIMFKWYFSAFSRNCLSCWITWRLVESYQSISWRLHCSTARRLGSQNSSSYHPHGSQTCTDEKFEKEANGGKRRSMLNYFFFIPKHLLYYNLFKLRNIPMIFICLEL